MWIIGLSKERPYLVIALFQKKKTDFKMRAFNQNVRILLKMHQNEHILFKMH